jgi:hypothetical protein
VTKEKGRFLLYLLDGTKAKDGGSCKNQYSNKEAQNI